MPEIKTVDFSTLFDFSRWARRFIEVLSASIRQAIDSGKLAGGLRANLTAEQIEDIPIQYEIIARQVARSELVNRETEKQVTSLLISMTQENASQQEMQRALRRLFEGYKKWRVDRITNTVVVGAFEAGQLESWKAAGIPSKIWISTADDRVREDHDSRVHTRLSEPIDINLPFEVGNSLLQHPGDPAGPANQVINCRCTMAPFIE